MLLDVEPLEAGPLYVIPQHLLFACGFGCVALGVARAGLDATIELACDKRPRFDGKTLAHDAVVQSQIGKAEATWRAAKALLYESSRATLAQQLEAECENFAASTLTEDFKNAAEAFLEKRTPEYKGR